MITVTEATPAGVQDRNWVRIMNTAAVIPISPAIELKRILYATDFSEPSLAALPLVSNIARRYGSHVFVANVCTPAQYPMLNPEAAVVLRYKDEREADAKAQALLNTKELGGLSATVIVRAGTPAEELNRLVHEQGIDLAVLATHGRTGWKHLVMGSVTEELFRGLSCPVLTVGPHLSKSLLELNQVNNILFPTDLSDESRAVFPALAALAAEYRASVTLLHILPTETGTNPDAKVLAEPLRQEMRDIFVPQISPRCHAEFVIDFGDAAERILAHAQMRNAELIGMEVRKAAEITTHFRNTVAYRVVLGAKCPVLTFRAEKA
jgi:nucleotide-binding universal stress UspA family protein